MDTWTVVVLALLGFAVLMLMMIVSSVLGFLLFNTLRILCWSIELTGRAVGKEPEWFLERREEVE